MIVSINLRHALRLKVVAIELVVSMLNFKSIALNAKTQNLSLLMTMTLSNPGNGVYRLFRKSILKQTQATSLSVSHTFVIKQSFAN